MANNAFRDDYRLNALKTELTAFGKQPTRIREKRGLHIHGVESERDHGSAFCRVKTGFSGKNSGLSIRFEKRVYSQSGRFPRSSGWVMT